MQQEHDEHVTVKVSDMTCISACVMRHKLSYATRRVSSIYMKRYNKHFVIVIILPETGIPELHFLHSDFCG